MRGAILLGLMLMAIPLGPSRALAAAAAPPPDAPAPLRPPASFANAGLAGQRFGQSLRPLGQSPALQGLQPVGDQSPQCRTNCAKGRITCEQDGGEEVCGQVWRQCLWTCSRAR